MPAKPVCVLLVEDDDDDFVFVSDLFRETQGQHALERVATYGEGLAAMQANCHDVYLLDFRLGSQTGLDLMKEARARGCHGPVILLTGQEDRQIDLDAMRAGATDYLPKSQINAPLLERSVRYALERERIGRSLRQAQKMEAVGRLAGGVAHDFNNMMTIVTGYSDLLLQKLGRDDPVALIIQEIKKAGERSAALTRRLLAFSRQQMLTLQAVNLNWLVAELEKMLRPLIGDNIRMVTSLDSGVCPVKVDPGQMEQALINLAVNARDAMAQGGTLTIETKALILNEKTAQVRPEIPRGQYALLAIRDTGCGMDAQTQAHIFEPFFTTKPLGQGTGLGLATVYGIIKQFDGYIYVASQQGQGTTFSIFLPCAEGPAHPGSPPAESQSLPLGKETILLVEDEPSLRAMMGMVLSGNGYRVLEAGNGQDALALLGKHQGPIHLLVTDVVMPEMGGRELARRFAFLYPKARVMYLSGYTEDAVIRQGVLDANMPFLQKPFSAEALAKKVREVLNREVAEAPR